MVFQYKSCDMLGPLNRGLDSDVMVDVIDNHVAQ